MLKINLQNVTILGEYERNDKALADVKLTVDYSPDPEQTLKLRGLLENHSDRYNVNYTYGLWGSHPATNLQLDVGGGVHYRRRRFYSHHLVDYRRSYLPTQVGEATTRIDIDNNEIEMKVILSTEPATRNLIQYSVIRWYLFLTIRAPNHIAMQNNSFLSNF